MVSIDVDWTILWQLANFLVLIWLLNIVLFKPVRSILKKRAALTSEIRSDINSSQEAAYDDQITLAQRQHETKNQGLKLWEEAKRNAQAEELVKLQQAVQKNNEFLAQQRTEIQTQIELAGAKLDHEVEQFARDIAGKILQRSLS